MKPITEVYCGSKGLGKVEIVIIVLLLLPFFFVLMLLLVKFGVTVYEYRTTFIFENRGTTAIDVNLGDDVKEFVVPDIPGWQKLDKLTVYLNGKDITDICVTAEYDGGSLIKTPSYRLKPGESVNITVIQRILVYWAESGFTINRKMLTLSSLYSGEYSDFLTKYASTNLNGFWSKESSIYSWKSVVELAEDLETNVNSTVEYIHMVAKWVDENIAYDRETLKIKCPAETLYERKGACGDRAALVTTLLRLKEIPSFLCLSIVYEKNFSMNISSSSLLLYYRNAALHIFSMACKERTCVPVDTTVKMSYGRSPYVDGAGINISDKVIILAIIKDKDPNDYLTITLPSSSTVLIISKTLQRNEVLRENLLIFLTAIILFMALVLVYIREEK